jgi:hypothetical protein
MKRCILTVALALSMFITALPAHAAGAQTIHHSFKGQLADRHKLRGRLGGVPLGASANLTTA